jgi:predicted flap endonuclease-1-like 5' DNA nuclease
MDLAREYWWVLALVAALIIAFLLLRPKQRVTLTDSAPVRPHMQKREGPAEGRGLAGESAAAASDVAGQLINAPVHRALDGEDDLCRMKGVGPKFASALAAAGLIRFDQIAALSPDEVNRIDSQLGTFSGRLRRDRIVEQAAFLARDDRDGFEKHFGRL